MTPSSMIPSSQIIQDMAAAVAAEDRLVLTSRLDNDPLAADVIILVDGDDLTRSRHDYEQRLDVPISVLLRVDEDAEDLAAERSEKKRLAEALLHELINTAFASPYAQSWTYAQQATAMHISIRRPDYGHPYAVAWTRVGFSVPTNP